MKLVSLILSSFYLKLCVCIIIRDSKKLFLGSETLMQISIFPFFFPEI